MNVHAGNPVIVWFRKDLRLNHNLALSAACQSGRPVVTLYIQESPESGNGPLGAAQRWWLHHSLQALGEAILARGGQLILRSGAAQDVLDSIIAETGADSIYWNRRYDPCGIEVDTDIKDKMSKLDVSARSFSGQLMHEPSRLRTGGGTPYRVFTPFWRALAADSEPEAPIEAPSEIYANKDILSERLEDWHLPPASPNWAVDFPDYWVPGEAAAQEKLADFVEDRLAGYCRARDLPAFDGTSLLSPHLAMGEITPGQIWHATRGLKATPTDDVITFRKELAWRDFSYHLLFHHPKLSSVNIHRKYDALAWQEDEEGFRRWTRGETGFPIVDAGMRQLWRHGYMHNRVRMIAASFLIKDLLIDWRRGEKWFRDTLVDADPASNAASWQWVAGSGADASPFFRIFNPITQGEKFDHAGEYVRRYVPELATLPDKYIHRPFDAPDPVLETSGVRLGVNYPRPMVDHALARQRALAALKSLSES